MPVSPAHRGRPRTTSCSWRASRQPAPRTRHDRRAGTPSSPRWAPVVRQVYAGGGFSQALYWEEEWRNPAEQDLYFPPEDDYWASQLIADSQVRVIPEPGVTSREVATTRRMWPSSTRPSRSCSAPSQTTASVVLLKLANESIVSKGTSEVAGCLPTRIRVPVAGRSTRSGRSLSVLLRQCARAAQCRVAANSTYLTWPRHHLH